MPSENLWGFPVRCWFFRDCFSFCLGCFDCWLVTLFLSVSLGWSFEIYVLCHTLRFCFYFLRLFANVFEIFESVWDFWRVYFPKLQCYKMHQNGVVEISEDHTSKANTNIYIIMYPNIWARVVFLKICSKFFLISVCILQINLCKPPQPLAPHWWVDQASRGPVEQFLGLQRYSETWLASMYQAGLPGSLSWARISWKRCWITVKVLELWVGIHAL